MKGEVKLGDDYARVEKTVVPAFEGNGSKLLCSETFPFPTCVSALGFTISNG